MNMKRNSLVQLGGKQSFLFIRSTRKLNDTGPGEGLQLCTWSPTWIEIDNRLHLFLAGYSIKYKIIF